MSEPPRTEADVDLRDDENAPAETERRELVRLAADTAIDVRAYLEATTTVASGTSPDVALPIVLLAVSQVLVAGARLGAIGDVVPTERFEPDPGPDTDVDPLHGALANVLEGLDDYADVVDPIVSGEVVSGSLSGDLATVAADLSHGLRHFESGRVDEALWWWQFSYLSSWGARAAAALRVVQSILAHLRLDADDEIVADAEFDALHPPR
ncbi:DUF5063 domain-containing protein [Angustibacter sp. Root456]|uniref:DUF5063 domain-containing protein n=1 Tax=Angustibacter sp. Root456 TaxID=1736539 RepID=UPI0009EB3CD8|nr:DUF5063 domain-containing protein [Angustibacter sp. Root456]